MTEPTPHESELLARIRARGPLWQRYVREEEVARGGMGAVLRVHDLDLDRTLAMKVILTHAPRGAPTPSLAETALSRFLDEARITAQLDHPGIVPVHDLGQDERGTVFFTMKLVEGEDLRAVFKKVATGAEGWNRTRVLGTLLRVCEAMQYAHDKGVIHRDLKPGNVMVGRYGETYVMDWGVARVLGAAPSAPSADATAAAPSSPSPPPPQVGATPRAGASVSATRRAAQATLEGDVIGTPAFMAPEQADGRVEKVGPWNDIYSLGALLYQLLAGVPPYGDGDHPHTALATLALARSGPPTPLAQLAPDAPPELIAICEKAMARDIAARYPSMGELAADLRAWLENRVVRAHAIGPAAELRKWVARNRGVASLAGVAVVVIAGLTAWFVHDVRKEKNVAVAERERVLRVSDVKRLSDLEAEADELWPARPEQVNALKDWRERARDLVSRREQHEATLAELRARGRPKRHPLQDELDDLRRSRAAAAGPLTPEQAALLDSKIAADEAEIAKHPALEFDDTQTDWWYGTLLTLVTGLDRLSADDPFGPTLKGMKSRLDRATTLGNRSVAEHGAEWDRTIAEIADRAATPIYDGLRITAQVGLVPLGKDAQSGLEEFWMLDTGVAPERGADGRLVIAGDTAMVFVLLPGGQAVIGAQRADPKAPRFDPLAEPDEWPLRSVRLAPVFISKYEVTQGQWLRVMGVNPSHYPPGDVRGGRTVTLAHPVEMVSWFDAREFVKRLGLALPTESQWETAARGRTETSWWTGNDPAAISTAGNVADRFCRDHGGPASWNYEDGIDDGHFIHAPVDAFLPNPFGLFGTIGNVMEWCLDTFSDPDVPLRDGDGRPLFEVRKARVVRGGSFDNVARASRSGYRDAKSPEAGTDYIGLRPVRTIDG